jgi:nitrogen fixation NifU-like protein
MNEHEKHHEEKDNIENMHGKYSDTVIEHARNPRNVGNLPKCEGFAQSTSRECGDTLSIWISVKNDIITRATFWTDGCVPTMASGSITTVLATGRPVDAARNIDKDVILDALDGLPEEHEHCAQWAAETLAMAVEDYIELSKLHGKKDI